MFSKANIITDDTSSRFTATKSISQSSCYLTQLSYWHRFSSKQYSALDERAQLISLPH